MSKKAAMRHSEHCLRSSGWPTGPFPSFIIRVDDRHNPFYWLTVLARPDAQLSDLDQLLRDVWMGCTDHPSAFTVEKKDYMSTNNSMAVALTDLPGPNKVFTYTYDPDSPTELRLKVSGTTPVMPPGGPLSLITRNTCPPYSCSICGKEADYCMIDSEDTDIIEYFCLGCITHANHGYITTIENSPRNGVCDYAEEPGMAITWYPPGWKAEELMSGELQPVLDAFQNSGREFRPFSDEPQMDDARMAAIMNEIMGDIGDELEGFIDREIAAHGYVAASRTEETVMGFCALMYGVYKKTFDEWDAPGVRTCLLEGMAQKPDFTDDWQEYTIPALRRFFTYMDIAGRLCNAAALFSELRETEPLFRETAMSRRNNQNQSGIIIKRARAAGVNVDDLNAMPEFLLKELTSMARTNPDSEEFKCIIEGLFGKSLNVLERDTGRYQMMYDRCEDFCNRLENEDITERCKEMVTDMAAHPQDPLSRGDGLLWSAAIVYAACQEEGMIGRAKGGSPLAREICEFFVQELKSVRNKVTVLKKYLAECPQNDVTFLV
ncbi:DUF6398 domain-containing protein [Methanogenium sp. MK-MG]|uniref:DUF6398 domain-containing protein n=1 Tax=Methanogenium sp. MK-MG TaxID=2599926 RepID=UPI0013EABAF3|nr:DUF6398 domain-containing protein [Methanogenium sp. MK-MG]